MPYNTSDPKYWFDRAEQARTRADAMKDPASKARILRIAEEYEDFGLSAQLVPKKIEDGTSEKTF